MAKSRREKGEARHVKSPKTSTPESRLARALGPARSLWAELVDALSAEFPPLVRQWKPTKLEFGWVCLLKQKDRTLAYLIPGKSQFEVSIVLGNRAAALALAGDLRAETKRVISEARVYAEGRGVRYFVRAHDDVVAAVQLVRFKTTPR